MVRVPQVAELLFALLNDFEMLLFILQLLCTIVHDCASLLDSIGELCAEWCLLLALPTWTMSCVI